MAAEKQKKSKKATCVFISVVVNYNTI
jgi:hypothetical protein